MEPPPHHPLPHLAISTVPVCGLACDDRPVRPKTWPHVLWAYRFAARDTDSMLPYSKSWSEQWHHLDIRNTFRELLHTRTSYLACEMHACMLLYLDTASGPAPEFVGVRMRQQAKDKITIHHIHSLASTSEPHYVPREMSSCPPRNILFCFVLTSARMGWFLTRSPKVSNS
jgi:hypothetical protein